jgi:GH35 family endo-1,4-beta-xylanase
MYGVSKALSDRGLVDAFGMQSHYFTVDNLTALEVTNTLNEVYDQTGLPIHITELDISGSDQEQLLRYQTIFPAMWNHPAVDRVTLWGWITGETWRHDQGAVTGLIDRDGTNERPAFEWLKEFFGYEDSAATESDDADSSSDTPSNINYNSYWQKI